MGITTTQVGPTEWKQWNSNGIGIGIDTRGGSVGEALEEHQSYCAEQGGTGVKPEVPQQLPAGDNHRKSHNHAFSLNGVLCWVIKSCFSFSKVVGLIVNAYSDRFVSTDSETPDGIVL